MKRFLRITLYTILALVGLAAAGILFFFLKYPNVDPLVETVDMREAQRSYEANLNVVTATRRMILKTLDILRA